MEKIICAPMGPNFEVPTETKIIHQLITNQTKMKLYLLDTYIQTPYQYRKRISKKNLSIEIGTSRLKDIVAINGFLFLSTLYFVVLACKMQIQFQLHLCVTTESQIEMLWLKKKYLYFPEEKIIKSLWLYGLQILSL